MEPHVARLKQSLQRAAEGIDDSTPEVLIAMLLEPVVRIARRHYWDDICKWEMELDRTFRAAGVAQWVLPYPLLNVSPSLPTNSSPTNIIPLRPRKK